MHRGVIVTAIAALCSTMLLGCSNGDPQADPTTSPTSPSVSVSDPPTTTPATTPTPPTTPTIPPLAQQQSVAGAKAFVRFYIEAINTSWHATSRRLCSLVVLDPSASPVEASHRRWTRFGETTASTQGGDLDRDIDDSDPLQTQSSPILHTAITVDRRYLEAIADDHLRKIEADKMYVDVHLIWTKTQLARDVDGSAHERQRSGRHQSSAAFVSPILVYSSSSRAGQASGAPCSGRSNAQIRATTGLRCETRHQHDGGGPLGRAAAAAPGRSYDYYWLPACPGAWPGVPGAEEMDCRRAHIPAPIPHSFSLSLFSRLIDGTGKPLTGWRYMRSECRSPKHIGPGDPRKTLTWATSGMRSGGSGCRRRASRVLITPW